MKSLNWIRIDVSSELAKSLTSVIESSPFKGLNVGTFELCTTFSLMLITALMMLFGHLAYVEGDTNLFNRGWFLEDDEPGGKLTICGCDFSNDDDLLVQRVPSVKLNSGSNLLETEASTISPVNSNYSNMGKDAKVSYTTPVSNPESVFEESKISNVYKDVGNTKYPDDGITTSMFETKKMGDPSTTVPKELNKSTEPTVSGIWPKMEFDKSGESSVSDIMSKVAFSKSVKSNMRMENVAKMGVKQSRRFNVKDGDEFYRESHVYKFIPPTDDTLIEEDVLCPSFAKSTLLGNPPPDTVSRELIARETNKPIDMDYEGPVRKKEEPNISNILL